MKGASRGLEGGLRRASRGLQGGLRRAGFKGASRGLQALLTFVPPPLPRGGTLQAPLEGYLRRWWLGSSPPISQFTMAGTLQVAKLWHAGFSYVQTSSKPCSNLKSMGRTMPGATGFSKESSINFFFCARQL